MWFLVSSLSPLITAHWPSLRSLLCSTLCTTEGTPSVPSGRVGSAQPSPASLSHVGPVDCLSILCLLYRLMSAQRVQKWLL